MMRALYSSVAGLKTHQTKMDVIGNNIANVNTVGFKSSRTTFSTMMYQTTSFASGANAETGKGGVNAKQIGLGRRRWKPLYGIHRLYGNGLAGGRKRKHS